MFMAVYGRIYLLLNGQSRVLCISVCTFWLLPEQNVSTHPNGRLHAHGVTDDDEWPRHQLNIETAAVATAVVATAAMSTATVSSHSKRVCVASTPGKFEIFLMFFLLD
jgi:hypothetical protein